jgi:hypothetical protein
MKALHALPSCFSMTIEAKTWTWSPTRVLFCFVLLSLLILIPVRNASAALISYTSTHLAGQTWRYDYELASGVSDPTIAEFTIYFDLAKFANLSVANSPSGWDSIVIDPDVALQADGYFDAVALSGGLSPGSSQNGFSVTFDYIGPGSPGAQVFEIVNPITFATISRGMTSSSDPVNVPEPGTAQLWAIVLPLLGLLRSRRPRPDQNRGLAANLA